MRKEKPKKPLEKQNLNSDLNRIVGAWSGRKDVELNTIISNISNSQFIDLLGFTMRSRFLKRDSQLDELIKAKWKENSEFKFRVILADPHEKESLIRRAEIEDGQKSTRLIDAVKESLDYVTYLTNWFKLSNGNANFQMEAYLVPADLIFGNLVIAENHIYLTQYLNGIRGTASPTFQFSSDSSIGIIYKERFEELIKIAKPYNPIKSSFD